MKEVDCSTIYVGADENRLDDVKSYLNWSKRKVFLSGHYRITNGKMFIYGNYVSIKGIVSILSHESLHKVIYETIGRLESFLPDIYLKYIDYYDMRKMDYSGLKLKEGD